MKPKICFICLKTIKTESFNCGDVHDDNSGRLYTRFRTFTKHYLGVSFYDGDSEPLPELSDSVVFANDDNDPLESKVVGGKEIFCEDCGIVVESIYQLYHELLTVQLRLSSKLGELGKLLEQSEEDISYKTGRMLINLLAQQMVILDTSRVEKLRSLLKSKCELRRKETMPQVKIQRDLNIEVEQVDDNVNPNIRIGIVHFYDDDEEEDGRDRNHQVSVVGNEGIKMEMDEDKDENKEDEESDGEDQTSFKSEPIIEGEQDDCSIASELEWSASSSSDSESDCEDFTVSGPNTLVTPSTSTFEEKRSKNGFHCISCPTLKSYKSKLNLSKHFKEVHSDQTFKCPECPLVLNSNRNIREHIVAVHKPETHPCLHCSKTFKSIKSLREHLGQVHAGPSTRRHPCPKGNCSKSYYKKQDLRNHVLKSHGESCLRVLDQAGFEVFKFECSDCKKKFPNDKRLQNHIRLVHEATPCESCGKVFVGSARKVIHVGKVHANIPQVCSECGVSLKSRKLLKDHMTAGHPLPKSKAHIFICEVCGKQFKTKNILKRHVNRVHSKVEKKFIPMQECKICGMPMKRKTEKEMEIHLRTHMSEEAKRVFLCDTCGKSFSRKQNCDIHVLRDHQGVSGEFKCEECPSSFFLKSILTRHIDRVHRK